LTIVKTLLERDPRLLTERDLQSLVLDVARLAGWKHYHTHNSKHSPSGFPDLVLAHPLHGVIFVELKSEQGKVSEKQRSWLSTLSMAGATYYVWRPSDWNEIVRTLTGREVA
jgi:hypothetical protein